MPSPPRHSDLDSNRFGRRIYRCAVDDEAGAREAAEVARRERVAMVIARCPVSKLAAANELERVGFRLMDTLVYYGGKTDRFTAVPSLPGVALRAFRPSDLAPLERVARASFDTDFRGHYHVDARLDRRKATEGYVEWFVRSTTNDAFTVHVAALVDDGGDGDRPVGFLTLKHGAAGEPAEIELNAVAPEAQGRGLYDALVKRAGVVARERGHARLNVSTQIDNVAPQKVWVRNGLEPLEAYYTFHGWFDGDLPSPRE